MILEISLDGTCNDYHAPRWADLIPPPGFAAGGKISDVMPPHATREILQAVAIAHERGRSEGQEFSLQLPQGFALRREALPHPPIHAPVPTLGCMDDAHRIEKTLIVMK